MPSRADCSEHKSQGVAQTKISVGNQGPDELSGTDDSARRLVSLMAGYVTDEFEVCGQEELRDGRLRAQNVEGIK